MKLPLQITFRDVPHSDAVEKAIRERAAKLERFSDCIISCRVIVHEPHRRRQQGDHFGLTIDVTIPGAELAVGYGGNDQRQEHENFYVAMRDSFKAIERQLKDAMALKRRETKLHTIAKPFARVSRLFPQDGYGFITTEDGREIYFHSNAVLNDGLNDLEVGSEVRFTEELGDKGPQAATLECLSKPAPQQAAG